MLFWLDCTFPINPGTHKSVQGGKFVTNTFKGVGKHKKRVREDNLYYKYGIKWGWREGEVQTRCRVNKFFQIITCRVASPP